MSRTPGSHNARRPPTDVLQRVWNSIRVLKRFTVADLAATAGAGRSSLHKYLRALAQAGLIAVAAPKRNGRVGGHTVWRLVRDLGPLRPLPRGDGSGVYDPNHAVVYPYGVEARDERALSRPGVVDRAP